jgi:hypothetical protein
MNPHVIESGRDGRRHQRFYQLSAEASVGRSALGEGGRRAGREARFTLAV